MKKLLLLVLGITLLASTATQAAFDSDRSEFRGYIGVNNILNARLIKEDSNFQLGVYLDDTFGRSDNLLLLLGAYAGGGFPDKFHNGRPNGVNMLLWYIAFSGLSHDIATLCSANTSEDLASKLRSQVNPIFIEALKPVCAWPAASAKTEDVLYAFWTAVQGFDPPFDEFEAWRAFFLGPDFAAAPALDAISAMALTMFMNPHFLLR